MGKRRIARALGKPLNQKLDKPRSQGAWLGNSAGVVVAGGNQVYVTLLNGQVTTAFNNRVAPVPGQAVWVGRSVEQPSLFQVLSTRTGTPLGVGGGAGFNYAPAANYQWMWPGGGQDPIMVALRQFLPLRVGMWDGMTVLIWDGIVWTGSAFAGVAKQELDLTSHIPSTSGKAAYVLITINTSATVVATKGSEVNTADLVGGAYMPAVPSNTVRVLAAVRVYNGQTAVQEAANETDIFDLRGTGWDYFGDSGLVKVSSNDTTPGYLNGKLVAGTGVTFAEGTDGGNETLTIAASGSVGGMTGYLNAQAAPYSAAGDGETDDSTALASLLSDAASQGKVAYIPPGRYLCPADLTVGDADIPGAVLRCDGELLLVHNYLTANEAGIETSAAGWTQANCTISQSAEQAHSGTQSLKVVAASAGDGYAQIATSKYLRDGEVYTFSAWVNIPSALTGGSAYLRVILHSYDGTVISDSSAISDELTVTAGWQRISGTINAAYPLDPSPAVLAALRLMVSGVGTVYFDDIQLERGGTLSAFETGGTTHTLTILSQHADVDIRHFQGTINLTSYEGRLSARVIDACNQVGNGITITGDHAIIAIGEISHAAGGILFQKTQGSLIDLATITACTTGLKFDATGSGNRAGENRIRFGTIRNCTYGVYFSNSTNWMEGNAFMGGAIFTCMTGFYAAANGMNGFTQFYGVIDGIEDAAAIDMEDHSYGNIYFFAFIREEAITAIGRDSRYINIRNQREIIPGYVDIEEETTPAAPPANMARLYARDASGTTKLYYKRSDNTEVELGGAGAGHDEVTVSDTTTIDLTLSTQALSADLKNTAVTPGSYTNADITIDAQGRITAAANGEAAGGGQYRQFAWSDDGAGGWEFVTAGGQPVLHLADLE